MLASDFPEIDFVQSVENVGFARSNNLGFALVRGEALLLLNPDTVVRAGAVEHLLRELHRLPDAGILGPRLLNTDLTLQTSVQALPRPLRQAFDSEFLRRVLSPKSLWAPPADFAPGTTTAVEAISGACMLLWTRTFASAGGFSADYFMYAEDMDLCLKVRRMGLSIYHVPGAEVIHHGGTSAVKRSTKFSDVMTREALVQYMRRNHGRRAALTYRVACAVASVMRIGMLAPVALVGPYPRRDAARSRLRRACSVLSWSVGLERWARRHGPPSALRESGGAPAPTSPLSPV
jgi:GT2 family glycosyltransferase